MKSPGALIVLSGAVLSGVLVSGALLLTAGCKKPERLRETRLVGAPELKKLERHFSDLGRKNRLLRCVRPVLRGQAVAGSASSDLLAALASSTLNRCRATLKKHDYVQWERYVPLWHLPDSEAARMGRTPRSLGSPNASSPATREVARDCAPVLSAVRTAVAHRDACGPFVVGVRGPPKAMSWIDLTRGLSVVARAQFKNGKTAEALASMLDGLRFVQDLSRGPQPLIVLSTTVLMMNILTWEVEGFLNGRGALPAGLAARVDRELGLLLAHEQHPNVYLRGELLSFALYEAMPKVFGDKWKPPGGLGAQSPDPEGSADDRDAMALLLVVLNELLEQVDSFCPPQLAPARCSAGLAALARQVAGGGKFDEAKLRKLVEGAKARGVKAEVRKVTERLLKGITLSLYPKYLLRLGVRRFRLAALRLHVRYRRLADARGVCPALAAFETSPLVALRKDPTTGRPMRIQRDGPGRFVVRMSARAPFPRDGLGPPALVIRCQH
jgi:hypothetical protein